MMFRIFAIGVWLAFGVSVAIADGAGSGADGWAVADDSPVQAGVPAVPLPPAFYGSAASVALIVALRNSRHRRWLTLRG